MILPGRSSQDPVLTEFHEDLLELEESNRTIDHLDSAFPGDYKMTKRMEIDDLSDGQFAYDAMIALGLAACAATKDDLYLDKDDFYNQITKVRFEGITGPYILSNTTNSRQYNSTYFNVIRLSNRPNTVKSAFFDGNTTDVYNQGEWTETQPFVFPDGSISLRFKGYEEEVTVIEFMNWIVVVAWILTALAIAFGLTCAVWTVIHRKSKIIRASQPFFLLLICTGAISLASATIPLIIGSAFCCNMRVWLRVIGISLMSSAFYSKLYRINKVMKSSKRCRRIKVDVKDVIIPVSRLPVVIHCTCAQNKRSHADAFFQIHLLSLYFRWWLFYLVRTCAFLGPLYEIVLRMDEN